MSLCYPNGIHYLRDEVRGADKLWPVSSSTKKIPTIITPDARLAGDGHPGHMARKMSGPRQDFWNTVTRRA